MREIKIRVWDSENGMHYLNMEETDDALIFRSKRHFDGDLTVMQYTEKKDKNGREIYEGDIVEYKDIVTNSLVVREVAFILGDWKVCDRELPAIDVLQGILSPIRVIGNIYEGESSSAKGKKVTK